MREQYYNDKQEGRLEEWYEDNYGHNGGDGDDCDACDGDGSLIFLSHMRKVPEGAKRVPWVVRASTELPETATFSSRSSRVLQGDRKIPHWVVILQLSDCPLWGHHGYRRADWIAQRCLQLSWAMWAMWAVQTEGSKLAVTWGHSKRWSQAWERFPRFLICPHEF